MSVLGELTVCWCSQDGLTALHLAAQEGRVDVVRLLTEAQAQVNIQDEVCIYTMGTICMYCYIKYCTRFMNTAPDL